MTETRDTPRRAHPALCAAPPVGGLRFGGWVRGCALSAVLAGAGHAGQEPVRLPSGQTVTFIETIVEADTNTLRLRYLAPEIGSPLTRPAFEPLSDDLEFLCEADGLKILESSGLIAPQVVVSLSAEMVDFGEISPDVEQIFEAFRVENGTCMLEMF